MKTKMKAMLVTVLPVMILFLAGCENNYDFISPNAHGQIRKYNIEMAIVKPPYANFTDTIRFTYNEFDNPVKGIRSDIRTGAPNYFFKYDKFRRMVALIAIYGLTPSDGVETWTKYTYDSRGRIVKDSVWVYPDVINEQPVKSPKGGLSVSLYEYDVKERITKVTWLREAVEPLITEYSYNNHGNRVGAMYDDKVNYHQTNKVWMFLGRDYSINNPLVGSYTYNNVGLPLTIDCGNGYTDFLMTAHVPISFSMATIKYNR